MTYPNGLVENRIQNVISGLQESKICTQANEILSKETYHLDNLFRLIKYKKFDLLTNPIEKEWKLVYDEESRLCSNTETNSGKVEVFEYDRKGNFKMINDNDVLIGEMDEILSIGGHRIKYDGNGNIETYEDINSKKFKFNNNNELKFAKCNSQEWEYCYDGLGRRIGKSNGKDSFKYVWASEKLLSEEIKKEGSVILREYIYMPSSSIPVAFKEKGKIYWLHIDIRGAVTKVFDDKGEIVWNADYDSFGVVNISSEEIRQPFRLMGQYFDEETGLHYNFNRYYSPFLKTFISIDKMALHPEASNYSYCLNNPFNKNDYNGNLSVFISVGATVLGGVAGFLVAGPAGAAIGGLIAGGLVGALGEEGGPWWHGALKGVTTSAIMEVGVLVGGLAVFGGAAVAGIVDSLMANSLKNEDICIPCALKKGALFAATAGLFKVAGAGLGKVFNATANKFPILKSIVLPSWKPLRLIKPKKGESITLIGSYKKDTSGVVNSKVVIRSKMKDFGPKNEDFNVLNVPDKDATASENFWEEYNKPWLEQATKRGDDIVVLSDPKDIGILLNKNKTGPSGFAKEIEFMNNLVDKGEYRFDANSGRYISVK